MFNHSPFSKNRRVDFSTEGQKVMVQEQRGDGYVYTQHMNPVFNMHLC